MSQHTCFGPHIRLGRSLSQMAIPYPEDEVRDSLKSFKQLKYSTTTKSKFMKSIRFNEDIIVLHFKPNEPVYWIQKSINALKDDPSLEWVNPKIKKYNESRRKIDQIQKISKLK